MQCLYACGCELPAKPHVPLQQKKDHMQKNTTKEICNIDLLRGLAAITILFWHYQHLYFPEAGVNPVFSQPSIQPLFASFSWLYTKGGWAVEFFWILSGFVFFHAYRLRREVSLREYAVNRFARLYPLHLITLLIVAMLQIVSHAYLGKFQIYPENDVYHFVLNLFMASHWGFQEGFSFNAPIWSISVEVLVYGLFFVFLKGLGVSLWSALAWLACSLLLLKTTSSPILQCAALFSLGGVVHQLSLQIATRLGAAANGILAGGVLVLVVALIAFGSYPLEPVVKFAVFPVLIWLAAALEMLGISAGRVGIATGNLTYSSYLIHVPIQICLILVMDIFIGSRDPVGSPVFLVSYLAGVLVAAHFTYRFVELPLKRRLRDWRPSGRAAHEGMSGQG